MHNEDDDFDHLYQIVLIGDSGVGQSNVLLRYTQNSFSSSQKTTIGVQFASQQITLKDDQQIKVQIWDTAGQEKFRAITKAYYRGAVGALVIFDITDKKSFDNIQKWLQEIKSNTDSNNMVVMLIGNKCDLEDRQVQKEEASEYSERHQIPYIETSAKQSTNIEFAFNKIVEEIYQLWKERSICVQADKNTIVNNDQSTTGGDNSIKSEQNGTQNQDSQSGGSNTQSNGNSNRGNSGGGEKLTTNKTQQQKDEGGCC